MPIQEQLFCMVRSSSLSFPAAVVPTLAVAQLTFEHAVVPHHEHNLDHERVPYFFYSSMLQRAMNHDPARWND